MDFKIEDYTVFISKIDEDLVEVEIVREENFITGTFSVDILNMSRKIKEIIKKNELSTFGYVRFNLN